NTGLSPVTLSSSFTIAGTGALQYSAGAPARTTLAAGAATSIAVTFAPTTTGTKTASLNVTSTTGDSVLVGLTGVATAPSGGSGATVVISEFRTRGPNGASDEFVEVYNNSDAAVDISGWKLNGSNNTAGTSTRGTVPPNTSLPARKPYLLTNSRTSG